MQRLVVSLVVVGMLVLLAARLWSPATAPAVPPPRAPRQRPVVAAMAAATDTPEAPAPRPPELAPGQAVTIDLTEPPATRYLSAKTDGNDAFYGRLLEEESRGKAIYDPALSRAAREFVYQYSNLGMDPPSDVRTFLTTAAGAIAGTLNKARGCYICKELYRDVDAFYHQLCPTCAALRSETEDGPPADHRQP